MKSTSPNLHNVAAGTRLRLSNEDFLITNVKNRIIEAEGIIVDNIAEVFVNRKSLENE